MIKDRLTRIRYGGTEARRFRKNNGRFVALGGFSPKRPVLHLHIGAQQDTIGQWFRKYWKLHFAAEYQFPFIFQPTAMTANYLRST